VVTWQDGYAQIVGERPGAYDKKKDARQPARAAVLDALTGAIVSDNEIADLHGWALASQLRRTNLNRTLLAVVTDEQDGVEVIDTAGRRLPLALPGGARVQNYDRKSLREQEDPARRALYFSLGLDPLNPDALGRQKADKPYLDLYRVQLAQSGVSGDARPDTARLLRATLDERPVTWVLHGGYVVLLRKHKSFTRGGNELEVYALPAR
jgi:hypothetical protein